MEHKIVFLSFIFIIYSFLGWVIESTRMAIKTKKLINRGMLNLPFVIVYGLGAVLINIAFFDTNNFLYVFLGSMIYASFLELSAGKVLEAFNHRKWWDYSRFKLNLDGYISLPTSILWGLLGSITYLYLNPLLVKLFYIIYYKILKIVIISILMGMVVDFIISYLSLTKDKNTKIIDSKSKKGLSNEIYNRVIDAYPIINKNKKTFSKDTFNIYKFLIYLVIGGVIGCLCEMVFCRFTMHRWMSRSSLLYGEISLVWGIALAIFTTFLYMHKKKNPIFIFVYGFILGTSFEYLCGSFCEYFYGYSFWSYKHLPFNINGRVQLNFAFIWGFASLIYIKFICGWLDKMIEKIPEKIGKTVVTIVVILLIFDILISIEAGIRFSERRKHEPPSNPIEEICDKYYTDEYMTNRFKNLKIEE